MDYTIERFKEDRELKYTSYGCYPKLWICSDGGVLCHKCVNEEHEQIEEAIRTHDSGGWRVVGCDVNWEDPECYCDHCNERIESAYAEDDAPSDE